VIRVENAERPDPNRFVGKDVLGEHDMRSYFLPNNCGKEAVTLNLSEAEGRDILRELVRRLRVDIFATNQRPRSYAKLGIDDATLRAVKPDLIWLGVTGFGPDHDEAAYDPILQARAGFMELTGAPDGPPTVFGLPMVDLGAAEHGYGAIMKALYRRAMTGAGARLDLSMLRSAVSWMVAPIFFSASLGERITRTGTTHQFFAPVSVLRTCCAKRASRSRGSTRWRTWSATRWWRRGSSTSETRAPASPSRCPRLRSATRRRSPSRRGSASTTRRSTARRSGTRPSGSPIS